MLVGICLDVSFLARQPSYLASRRAIRVLTYFLPSNVVLTLSNGGKAGTIYMLLVAICGVFFVCLCESNSLDRRICPAADTYEAMAEMASIAPTAYGSSSYAIDFELG